MSHLPNPRNMTCFQGFDLAVLTPLVYSISRRVSLVKEVSCVYVNTSIYRYMKYLGLFAALVLAGAGCTSNTSANVELELQREKNLELKQERLSDYRKECQEEWQAKLDLVDRLVKDTPGITSEQTQNLGRNAGIIDADNYVIDDDIWVKGCVDEKTEIFE